MNDFQSQYVQFQADRLEHHVRAAQQAIAYNYRPDAIEHLTIAADCAILLGDDVRNWVSQARQWVHDSETWYELDARASGLYARAWREYSVEHLASVESALADCRSDDDAAEAIDSACEVIYHHEAAVILIGGDCDQSDMCEAPAGGPYDCELASAVLRDWTIENAGEWVELRTARLREAGDWRALYAHLDDIGEYPTIVVSRPAALCDDWDWIDSAAVRSEDVDLIVVGVES